MVTILNTHTFDIDDDDSGGGDGDGDELLELLTFWFASSVIQINNNMEQQVVERTYIIPAHHSRCK